MDDKIQQNWLDLGYDQEKIPRVVKNLADLQYAPENATLATPIDVCALFRQYLGGLVLFSGRVVANSGFTVVLEDEQMCVTTCKVDEERSMYIHPLEKRIKGEYIRMDSIQTNDTVQIEEKIIRDLDTFYLIIRDFRKNIVASFEFRKDGRMLYVPKRANPQPLDNPLDNSQ